MILDSYGGSGANQCWQKINYRGDPHEFGAYGDGIDDNTGSLENWLGAYGTPLASSQTKTNFGPWNLTVPGVYDVQNPNGVPYPLVCPTSGALIAGANLWAGFKSSGTPAVTIFADNGGTHSNWGSSGAVLAMSDNCRLSGVAINANKIAGIDGVDILGRSVAIDSHSVVEFGNVNINCNLSVKGIGLQVKDTQIISATSDNVVLGQGCANVRLIGDLNTGAGNRGVADYTNDMILADGVVEQANGVAVDLEGANYVSITSNYIDHNGKSLMTSSPAQPTNIFVNGGSHISICANHIQGGGNSAPTAPIYSSQIYLEGQIDNLSTCGNVYTANTGHTDVTYTPQYVFDAAPAGSTSPPQAILTNSSINESPETQAAGIYSPNAISLLPQLKAPHVAAAFISGFTLSNVGAGTAVVSIGPGEASDSSNTSSLVLTSPCTVDLGSSGNNGLDTSMVLPQRTYFYYVIANPGGGNPGCMASLSPHGPVFTASNFVTTGYQLVTTGSAVTTGNAIFNVGSIAGAAIGNPVMLVKSGGTVAVNSTISSFSTISPITIGSKLSLSWASGNNYLSYATGCLPSGLVEGMAIIDTPTNSGPNCIANGTYIQTITSTINLSQPVGCSSSLHDNTASASVEQQINVPATPSSNTSGGALTIYSGVYRLVGALYTDASSHVVGFTQFNNTFYLTTPTKDIPTSCTITSSSATSCALSVPCGLTAACASGNGVQVEAFGRIVGGVSANPILLSSLNTSPGSPTLFSATGPGYTTKDTAGQTSFPFRIYTDFNVASAGTSGGSVRVQTTASGGATVYEVTDGWVFQH